MGYIYLITNKIDNKKYVGQTIGKDIFHRWNQHKNINQKSYCRYLYNALKLYKLENFKFEIICICFDEDCNKYEENYIKKFNTLAPNGYNLREGGKNGKQHPDSNEKRRIANTGKKYKPLSDELKKIHSNNKLGEKNYNFGKKMSDEQKRKISEKQKEHWKNQNVNNIKINQKKLEGLKKGIEKIKKKVNCYSLKEEFIITYESLSDGARKSGAQYSAISKCCNNIYKTAGGFIWKFV